MKRWLTLAASIAAVVVGSKLLIENVLGLTFESALDAWMADAGTGSAVTVLALLAADIVLPVPSSLIMVLSGAAFGVVWGSVLSLVGSIGGEWLGFELVRRYGRSMSQRLVGDDEVRQLERLI